MEPPLQRRVFSKRWIAGSGRDEGHPVEDGLKAGPPWRSDSTKTMLLSTSQSLKKSCWTSAPFSGGGRRRAITSVVARETTVFAELMEA